MVAGAVPPSLLQKNLNRADDWPIDINPKGEFNLDYGRYASGIEKNIAEAQKGLLEVEQKSTLEQMKQEALNRLKR